MWSEFAESEAMQYPKGWVIVTQTSEIRMSIRLLARELYKLGQEVEQLEEKLAAATVEKRAAIEELLRKARAEKERVRRALDGQIGR